MNPSEFVKCQSFPCVDVDHTSFLVPAIEIEPSKITVVVISETVPPNTADDYYAGEGAAYQETTLQAFNAAGFRTASFQDLLDLGIYFTSAVKCSKTGYGIKAGTIRECSRLLEREIEAFDEVKAFLLMGDVAIKAINYIAKREGEGRAIPAGSTYKIRGKEYFFRGARAFPSYLQVGPSFGIEKSKQRMITEDIAQALDLIGD